MKLEVHERFALLPLLPTQGDYAALKTLRRAREMISFTPEEIEFYEIKPGGAGTVWSPLKASQQVKDCPVDEYTTNVIREALSKLQKDGKLTENQLSIYEKFVIDYR